MSRNLMSDHNPVIKRAVVLHNKKPHCGYSLQCGFLPAIIYPPGPLPAKYFRRVRA